jgi:xanthine dehydrogenase accessory factor
VIVDDRADFANTDRFPDADSIVVPASFDGALEGLPVDEQSYLVIMTRGHLFDRVVLAQALRTRAGYIGMIGSRKKIAGTFGALREAGFADEDLSRVHAPIGVDIGAETPEEIAVSIAAEIIRIRRGIRSLTADTLRQTPSEHRSLASGRTPGVSSEPREGPRSRAGETRRVSPPWSDRR